MPKMYLSAPIIGDEDGHTRIAADLHIDDRVINLWFKTKSQPINEKMAQAAFLAAVLIPAMKIGGSLRIEKPIPERLMGATKGLQQVFNKWYPTFNFIEILADTNTPRTAPAAPRAAQFFSGGVDSFYTLLENFEDIQDLYHVRGFDLLLEKERALELATARVKGGAEAFGKNFAQIETNIHDFSKEFAHWPNHYHGSAMAAMAILMSARNPRFYFAATHSYADMFPWGSHPLLDHFWSNDDLEIIHHGAEATRLQKVYRIARDPEVLKHLNIGQLQGGLPKDYRPGEKLLRTLIALDLAGVLDQAVTFEYKLNLQDVRNIRIIGPNSLSFVMENYTELLKRPDKVPLRNALRVAIQRYHNRVLARGLARHAKSFRASPHFEELKKLFGLTEVSVEK
jgi:hypothetical protein